MYACLCRAIPEAEVRRVGHAGVTTPEDLIILFGLNDPACCGRCARQPAHLVALAAEGAVNWEREPATSLPSIPRLVAGVAWELLQAAVRPMLRLHQRGL